MNILISGLIIFVFACIAAVLSASETSVIMASRVRLHQLKKKGSTRAPLLLSLQENMSSVISTLLLGNTCLFAAITSLATKLMDRFLGNWGVLVASFLMGAVITLYLEVLPKIYAYQCPEKVALALAPLIKGLRVVLRPVTHLIDTIAYKILALFKVKMSPRKTTLEDLQGAIDLHIGDGPILHERVMLRSILDLSRVTVEEIMVHRKNIISFNADLPSRELGDKILRAQYTRIPLWRETPENIVGVINFKNLARALQEQPMENIDFESLMQAPWFIPDASTLFSQLQLFKEKHIHQAFVVDEYGSLLGMVTLEDILEEIVGEITDEHDVALPGVRMTTSGEYLIRGDVTLRDLHRQYDWELWDMSLSSGPSLGPSTLAGLILQEARSIPHVGTSLMIKGFRMKIVRRHKNQIVMISVTPPSSSAASVIEGSSFKK